MKKKDKVLERFDKEFRVDIQTRLSGKDIIKHNEEVKSFLKQELEKAVAKTKKETAKQLEMTILVYEKELQNMGEENCIESLESRIRSYIRHDLKLKKEQK